LIVNLNTCIAFSSQKTSSSFVDLYVGIAKFSNCCDVVFLGHMCGYIILWGKSNQKAMGIFSIFVNHVNTYFRLCILSITHKGLGRVVVLHMDRKKTHAPSLWRTPFV
jgi:hypothetical protein